MKFAAIAAILVMVIVVGTAMAVVFSKNFVDRDEGSGRVMYNWTIKSVDGSY